MSWGFTPLLALLSVPRSLRPYLPVPIPFLFTPFHTLLRFFALTQNSTLLFSIVSALFAQNTRGWGTPQVPGAECREQFIFSTSPQSQLTRHVFIRTVTCPEGVHRTYYWNRRAFPPNFSQARVPLFPIA